MTQRPPIRLCVDMTAKSKEELISKIEMFASDFFGDESHFLQDDIEVMYDFDQLLWTGTAYFINDVRHR